MTKNAILEIKCLIVDSVDFEVDCTFFFLQCDLNLLRPQRHLKS